MSDISYIAKEVHSAADYKLDWECSHTLLPAIAAAIQVALNGVISPVDPPAEVSDEYSQGFLAAHQKYRSEFLTIIKELETDYD